MTTTDAIYRLMEDVQLKRTASDLLCIFGPMSKALDRMQRDSCVVSECFEIW